ncbi:MAG: chromosome segregation protein SMC [Bacteroidetes bacterium]|nr:chromosome segregation protein SMC [Bacteroidota bacterium]
MYLSKLELHGFKSFADRTVVDFSPGVTVVVGPNGCGKSNIVDAVRWVIGEQRARILRSDKMDSVIFNGTSNRRALGMSEVLLTIENTRGILPIEYSEVTIGRRLFRSGESEYLLNGTQCRLKDITDLFMDTGMGAGAYSVIELKMIEEILSDNAIDRRHLFEEAAGITKYKIRRGQTLRKLKGTQSDLDRVRDLTDELEKRVVMLERQAQKAGKYKKYETRLHALELMLAGIEYRQLASETDIIRKEIARFSDTGSELSAKLATEEAGYEAFRTDHVSREKVVTDAQSALADHMERLRALESDLRLGTERLSAISRDLTRLEEERAAAFGQKETLVGLLDRSEKEMSDVLPAAEKAEGELTDAKRIKEEAQTSQQKHQVMLHNLRLDERNAFNSKTDRQRLIDRLSSRIEISIADLEVGKAALLSLEASAADIDTQYAAQESLLIDALRFKESTGNELAATEMKIVDLNKALEIVRQEMRAAERAHDAAAAEGSLLEGLLSGYDDFSEPVQFLASAKDWTKEKMLTVADVLSCDESHRIAVDAALGEFASCVVVATEAEARAAIRSLRTHDKGRATFLVMERLPKTSPQKPHASFTALGSKVRVTDNAFSNLIPLLFASCYLVDSLEDLPVEIPGKMFTSRGEWSGLHGTLHGGSEATGSSAASARLGRKEQLEEARERVGMTHKTLQKASKSFDSVRAELDAIALATVKGEFDRRVSEYAIQEKTFSRTAYERETLKDRRAEIEGRIARLTGQKEAADAELALANADLKSFTVKLAELQNKRTDAEAAFSGIEEASRKAFSLFNEANITAVQTRNRLDNLRRDVIRTKEELNRLELRSTERIESVERLSAQKIELERRSSELQHEIRAKQDAKNSFDETVSKAKDSLMETKVAISEKEVRLRELRRDREATLREESNRAIRKAELETRLQDLVASIQEDFEIDLSNYDFEVPEEFSRGKAKEEVQTLRTKIRNLGPVNALALDSFEEERTRLEFMTSQLADLVKAEATLMTTIDEINVTASERFNTTFGAIRENFQKLFVELFGDEASADISLQDESDPLESDVVVVAKPKGKKPSVLAQLSGGEKTLTAIALLFAIYLVKPSPFCILDEVDAPLDDANVDRFMHLIRTFSDSTQFILVTHNKRTMEAADRMYGITMQEQGVSKLVGVKFDGKKADLTLVA